MSIKSPSKNVCMHISVAVTSAFRSSGQVGLLLSRSLAVSFTGHLGNTRRDHPKFRKRARLQLTLQKKGRRNRSKFMYKEAKEAGQLYSKMPCAFVHFSISLGFFPALLLCIISIHTLVISYFAVQLLLLLSPIIV